MTDFLKNSAFPVVVSAPSGAGKTSICREVARAHPDCVYSISVTSRPRSATEQDGEDYVFISKKEFEEDIQKGQFLEWTQIRGRYYGTRKQSVEDALKKRKTVLLDLDVHGARTIQDVYSNTVSVYILSPSLKDLEKRLKDRGRDSEEEIAFRLRTATEEMKHIEEYDYVIVNTIFRESVERLRCIIEAEKCKIERKSDEWMALLQVERA
ncbi:MAG: guanylate kinase [Gemmatimonadota bacterium]|nr:MAG: guanylate kinase [Gemmatimonadota bacterium]